MDALSEWHELFIENNEINCPASEWFAAPVRRLRLFKPDIAVDRNGWKRIDPHAKSTGNSRWHEAAAGIV